MSAWLTARSSTLRPILQRRISPPGSPQKGSGLSRASGRRSASPSTPWIAAAAAGLAKGLVLLIDYGHPAAALYDNRRRPEGTLAAYLRHQVHHDPYRAIGRQDLTAHVDVTAVERAAHAAGLEHVTTTIQAHLLAGLGAGDLLVELQTGPSAALQDYLEARSALVRMIDPAAMGGFAVMVFGRSVPTDAPLRGMNAM